MPSGDVAPIPAPGGLHRQRPANLSDVALLAGVSEPTASGVLGDTRNVRPELRKRVLVPRASTAPARRRRW